MQIVTAIIALIMIMAVHEGGHFLGARAAGMRVLEVALGWGKRLWTTRRGETDYSVNALPVVAYVAVDMGEPDSGDPLTYRNRPLPGRLAYVAGGPLGNFVFAALLLFGLFIIGGVPTMGVYIKAVAVGSPAISGGLQAGDQLVSLAGRSVRGLDDVAASLQGRAGQPIPVQVLRAGSRQEMTVVPRADQNGAPRLGITIEPGSRPLFTGSGTLSERVRMGWRQFTGMTVGIAGAYLSLFTGHLGLQDLGGPVSIVHQTAQVAAEGSGLFVLLVASLSINIGLINLLPIPGLDGGRLLFLLVEAIFRVRVREERQEQIHAWGLLAVLALAVLLTVRDVAGLL
ncbi:MAG TPA: M50 family metallopeptidase [Symbiobacteriaceae bacterium]